MGVSRESGPRGRKTAQRIIETARELLMEEGYAQFSMRNVAARAGMHLANVQYYFRRRDDLIKAILHDTDARYRAGFSKALAAAAPERVARFHAIIGFSLKDIARASTRRFFIQLWALLCSRSMDLLNDSYAIDIQHLCECIAELDPQADGPEVRIRATLLAAMIEGLLVVHGAHSRNAAEMKRLMMRAHDVCMQIALGRMNQRIGGAQRTRGSRKRGALLSGSY
jgi:AcrR family transcriptional regulator